MCRIAGTALSSQYSMQGAEPLERLLIRMRDAQAHGGPDDAGLYINPEATVGLAHRRLSLLDLTSAGHQPMSTEYGSNWLSFNGEIYNFLPLREQLKAKGYSFRTQTDTEVILNAYAEWQEKAFEKLEGMFAFALYDALKARVYLVRDASGIKPLYYSQQQDRLLFASEVRAFAQSGLPFAKNPDWDIFYLSLGFISEPYTTLQGVYMLPKACYLQWDIQRGSGKIHSYRKDEAAITIDEEQTAREAVRQGLTASVYRHLISDAPIGVFLSGGTDSSLLALIAGKELGRNLRTLSVSFREKNFDEGAYQHLVAQRLEGRHASLNLDKTTFLEALPETLKALDQPSVDGINTWFITKYAKQEGLKAVLSGIGGDELFGGYPSFIRIPKLKFYRTISRSIPRFAWQLTQPHWAKMAALHMAGDIGTYLFLRGVYPPSYVAKLIDGTESEIVEKLSNWMGEDNSRQLHPGVYASWLEKNYYMQQQLLKDTDCMSMWHGVEVRVPFLDNAFMATVARIHPTILYNRDKPKGLLIDSFENILPEQVWNRPKKGFTLPFQEWLQDTPYLQELRSEANPVIASLLRQFDHNALHWSRIWALLVWRQWQQCL